MKVRMMAWRRVGPFYTHWWVEVWHGEDYWSARRAGALLKRQFPAMRIVIVTETTNPNDIDMGGMFRD